MMISKFSSEAQARSWHDDPDYQALSAHRRAGTELSFLIMVRGMAPRANQSAIAPRRHPGRTNVQRPLSRTPSMGMLVNGK